MIAPTLTVDEGEVKVKRNGNTQIVNAGDEPFPLRICDEISTDGAIDTAWSIKAAQKDGGFPDGTELREAPGSDTAHALSAVADLRRFERWIARLAESLERGSTGESRLVVAGIGTLGGLVGPLGLVPQIVQTVMPMMKADIDKYGLRGVGGGGTALDLGDDGYMTATKEMVMTITHKDGSTQEHHIPKGTRFSLGDPMYFDWSHAKW